MKAIFSLCTLLLLNLQAQDTLNVIVVSEMGEGTYKIEINGELYRAIPESTMKQLLKMSVQQDAIEKENRAKDSLLVAYEKADFWYATLLERQKAYIGEMEMVLNGYKELVTDYKKLGEPWLTATAGIGASGPDTKPAVLFGLGVQRFRIWGLLQERNSGVMLGAYLPLF
jgi:hypothetical protein